MSGGLGFLPSDLLFLFQTSEWSHLGCLFLIFFFIHSNVFRGKCRIKWRPGFLIARVCKCPSPLTDFFFLVSLGFFMGCKVLWNWSTMGEDLQVDVSLDCGDGGILHAWLWTLWGCKRMKPG